jgi:hypothetical protein
MNACGVVVAMRQGHSWAPLWTSGHAVNVGTIPVAPSPLVFGPVDGKARRRLTLPGWDGGLVVVGGRESRPHGEGVQRDRSFDAPPGGRW